jgi:hypothetical protein
MKPTKVKQRRPPLTDAERRERFVETAKKVGASDDIDDFDKAFSRIAKSGSSSTPRREADLHGKVDRNPK